MTETQARGALIKNRLDIINSYVGKEMGTKKPFDIFLRENKITKKEFVRDLPPPFNAPPTDFDAVFDYGVDLNKLYFSLFQKNEMELAAAAAKDKLALGIVDGDYIPAYANGDGDDYENASGAVGAAAKCGIPPIKPLRARSKAPEKWAEYDRKKAAYDKCVAAWKAEKDAKKEDRKNTERKGLHELNKYNPLFVSGRGAFLSLVALNVFQLAYNIARIRQKDSAAWKRITTKWYNIGGDKAALENAINKGKDKRGIFGVRGADGQMEWDGRYSFTGAEIATFVATATPIIAAMKPIITEFKRKQGEPTNTPDITELPLDPGGPIADTLRLEDADNNTGGEVPGADVHSGFNFKNPVFIAITVAVAIGATVAIVAAVRKKS